MATLQESTRPERYPDASWRAQESTFCVVHLSLLAILLLVHTIFAEHFGPPSLSLLAMLSAAFVIRIAQLIWIRRLTDAVAERTMVVLSSASIVLNLNLAFAAALLTDRSDAQYFVLLVMPVIEAAFRFQSFAVVLVITISALLNFLWIAIYVHRHGSIAPNEYFEAGSISMIYAFVGVLVWALVRNLHRSQRRLASNLRMLRHTEEKLLREEKLAAVGRLSSAIAHEVRNPVAMISSSLATALRGGIDGEERARMYEIAAAEAVRLEKLTTDFLDYARPRQPAIGVGDVVETVALIRAFVEPYAAERGVEVELHTPTDLLCAFDSVLLQHAITNLIRNAIEASPRNSTVTLSIVDLGGTVSINVENGGTSIPGEAMAHIFEPFFTTKAGGTGLGLAIARNAVQVQGGELSVTRNDSSGVTFSLTLPKRAQEAGAEGRD